MADTNQTNSTVSFSGLTAGQSKEILALLGDVVTLAHEIVNTSKLAPMSKPTKSLSLMMLFHMAEKGETVHRLADSGLSAGVETIVRSMFETHIDLQNLHNYPKHYPNYLFAATTIQQRKQLDVLIRSEESRWKAQARKIAASAANCTLEDLRAEKDAELKELVSQLPDRFLRGDEKKRLETNIEVRAKWAGLQHEYDQTYRYLSAMSHSDIIAVTRQSGKHVPAWWPRARNPCPGIVIWSAANYVIHAIDRVSKKLNLNRHKLSALQNRMSNWIGGSS